MGNTLARDALLAAAGGVVGAVTVLAIQRVLTPGTELPAAGPGCASSEECVAVILGSAFGGGEDGAPVLGGRKLRPVEVRTPFGQVTLWEFPADRCTPRGYVIFRHGWPHRWLPHRVPYRAHVWALHRMNCKALLLTSSVGVLNPRIPTGRVLPVSDVVMLSNQLPDGSSCTMFQQSDELPALRPGHLVVDSTNSLFSKELTAYTVSFLRRLMAASCRDTPESDSGIDTPEHGGEEAVGADTVLERGVLFGYVPGPRTKTPAENGLWSSWGLDVNSMTLAPEAVLASEMGIPVAAVVTGHKPSRTERDPETPSSSESMAASLDLGKAHLEQLSQHWLTCAPMHTLPSSWLYRFGDE
jgi:5'-methylthioadenosine phosphorylase